MAVVLKDESDTWEVCDKDLVPGGDKDTFYTVRRLTLETHRAITKKHTKPGTYRRPEGKRDEEAIQDDLFDYVLEAWRGVQKDGKDVPCSWDFKALLDVPRRIALLDEAGLNDITAAEEARGESFRGAGAVR
jgi:hypothetical protein